MTKRETYFKKLEPLLDDAAELERFLLEHSGLPGRRANLELAAAFADRFETGASEAQWKTLVEWASLSPDEAPTSSRVASGSSSKVSLRGRLEFLPFSAMQALGAIYLDSDEKRQEDIFAILRAATRSERWRTREAAAFAFQRIGERDFDVLKGLLSAWLDRASLAEWRAIVAALAHPAFFGCSSEGQGGRGAVAFALDIAGRIMAAVRKLPKTGRETEEFRVLRKGLGYALSVFVAASPDEGFRFLRKWAEADDIDIKKIVGANIRKARLAKRFPDECREVGETLSWGA